MLGAGRNVYGNPDQCITAIQQAMANYEFDAGPHADTRQIEDDDRGGSGICGLHGQCRGNVTCADAERRSVPQVEAECDVLPADGLTDLTQDIERCQRFQSDDHASGTVGDCLPRAFDRRNARVQPNGGD